MNEELPPKLDMLLTPIITVAQQVAKLQGSVDEGFKGVHLRQDIANGRTAKIEQRVISLEQKRTTQDGVVRGIEVSWKFLAAILTLIIGFAGVIAYLIK